MKNGQFLSIIEIDEERMRKDGLNPEQLKKEIDAMANDTIGFYEKRSGGIYAFNSSGAELWFRDCLEQNMNFMKYVCKWVSADPLIISDVIKWKKENGILCCYE